MRVGEGFVEEIKDNGLAKVRVSRDSLYVACSVCAAADHVKLLAYNSIGAAERFDLGIYFLLSCTIMGRQS